MALIPSTGSGTKQNRCKTRLLRFSVTFAILAFVAAYVLTDSSPSADARDAPTALQVGAGRDAVYRLGASQEASAGKSQIRFGPAQLDGLSAMASDGFQPGRLNMYVRNRAFYVTASYPLPLRRWLNVNFVASERSKGFPKVHTTIGSLNLPPRLSRFVFDATRALLRFRGAVVPPLDQMVRAFSVDGDYVAASVNLPRKSGLIDGLAGAGNSVDPAAVAARYCLLAKLQSDNPQSDFALHVNRAFSVDRPSKATPVNNQATFIALAMIVVDQRVGYLVDLNEARLAKCTFPRVPITLHGREDLPKHWALSAALAAGTNSQLAKSMGEWKEMADSLSKQSEFQLGDPSGFSFVDLSSDRAGLRTANVANSVDHASTMAQRLSVATAKQLLPLEFLDYPEGLTDRDFSRTYGAVDDPRYAKIVRKIDEALDKAGLEKLNAEVFVGPQTK
jgi:hypothetical protein